MMRYEPHKKFKNIHPAVKAATKELIRAKLWQEDPQVQMSACAAWLDRCSSAYEMTPPALAYVPTMHPSAGGGAYNPLEHALVLSHFSITTLLHEFRHAWQRAHCLVLTEQDACAWSWSVFYACAPRRFENMARAARIAYFDPSWLDD